mgnify:CR=1 FL=1
MTQQQVIQLIVVVLVAGSSVITWVFRKLSEQAALKKAEGQREREKLEVLRTGRIESDEPRRAQARPAAGAEDLEQLARRRAEQLRQLREMQLAKQRAAGGVATPTTTARNPIRSIPGSSGPTVPGRRTPSPVLTDPGQSRVEERRVKQAQRAQKAQLEALRRAESEALKLELTASRKTIEVPRTSASLSAMDDRRNERSDDRSILSTRPRPSPLAGMTRADWKRAFLAKEVLGKPISMRLDHLR